MIETTPEASAMLSPDGTHWIVQRCPYCGDKHYHGAGGPGADHAAFLGHRLAHCSGSSPHAKAGYVLVATPTHRAGPEA